MKILKTGRIAAAVACLGLLMPQGALAAPAAKVASNDVALRTGGTFVGQVVNAQGKPLTKTAVSVTLGDKEIVRTTTDKNGVFAAKGLRGGQYNVVAGGGVATYQLWAENTAPPVAAKGALIVTGQEVVAGQCGGPACGPSCGPACGPGYGGGGGGLLGFVKNHPLLVAGGIAAAIAIPLALADDDDPAPATP